MPEPVDETDRTLVALVREEAARAGAVSPPPLAELYVRASTRRRRRTALVALGAAAAVVGIATWQVLPGDAPDAYVPPAGGPIGSTFPVPSYDWDGGSGMDALVGGTLWFTAEGCTMMSNGVGEDRVTEPVFFPNATGVTYDNGVRAVVDGEGRVFAVEGQEFSYGGGGAGVGEGGRLDPASELARSWNAVCPEVPLRGGAVINDVPAGEPLTAPPPAPDEPGPTAPTTGEELGWYEVPTFEWDPEQGGDGAQIEGRVVISPAGCPLLHTDDGQVVALVFPNAEGREEPDRQAIWGTVGGTHGVFAEDGQLASFTGGHQDGHPDWERLCGTSEPAPASWFWVYQAP